MKVLSLHLPKLRIAYENVHMDHESRAHITVTITLI